MSPTRESLASLHINILDLLCQLLHLTMTIFMVISSKKPSSSIINQLVILKRREKVDQNTKSAVFCIIAFALLIFVVQKNQPEKIDNPESMLHTIDRGIFTGNPAQFDTINKVITVKTSSYPVRIWEDENGKVMVKRYVVSARKHQLVTLPANDAEIAFYRTYFAEKPHYPKHE
jgi:hypothetical protein